MTALRGPCPSERMLMSEPVTYDAGHHYRVERELADRLRQAPAPERGRIFGEVYDELFRLVPAHPQLARKKDRASSALELRNKMRLLSRYVTEDTDFLEIGAGDCVLSRHVSKTARSVVAVDVSEAVASTDDAPPNFRLVLTDGLSVPLPDGSISLAYSNQLMEHLHPDDVRAQLTEIIRVLRPGGGYLVITPSRLSGPHDISRGFDDVATGFHLKEYTRRELSGLLKLAGFRHQQTYAGGRGRYVRVPTALVEMAERSFERLPKRVRRTLRSNPVLLALFGVNVYAQK